MLEPLEVTLTQARVAPVRWGILGPGLIARGAMMPAFETVTNAEVVAVASRDRARAQAFATEFHIPRAYAGYDLLIDDPDIEAIYIALPNHLHAEWAIRAAQAGKHILCEKPLAATVREAQAMVAAAEEADVILMEAVMYRFHPRMRDLGETVREGAIGAPMLVRSSFCFTMTDPENYRNDPGMGGGALLDVGSYCINVSRYLIGEEPLTVTALGALAESGVDASVSGVLAFPSGALAQIQCSFASFEQQALDVTGDEGVIELARPFTAWRNDETSYCVVQGDQQEETIFPPADPYALMAEHFSDCVRGQVEPLLPPEDGVGTLRVIDALRRSLDNGRAERVLS